MVNYTQLSPRESPISTPPLIFLHQTLCSSQALNAWTSPSLPTALDLIHRLPTLHLHFLGWPIPVRTFVHPNKPDIPCVFNEIFGACSNAEIDRNPASHLKSRYFLANTLFPHLRRLPLTVQAHVNLGSSKKSLPCFLSYIFTLPGVTIRRKLYMHFLQGEQILEYERRRTVAPSMNFIYSVFLTVTRLLLSCWMIDSPL